MVAGGFLWGTKSWTRPNWRSFSFCTWKSAAGQIGISPIEIVWYAWFLPCPSARSGCRCAGRDLACSGSTTSPSPSCTSCGPGPACTPSRGNKKLSLSTKSFKLAHLPEETNNFPFLLKVSSLHTLVWIKFSSSQSTESKQIREQRGNIRIGRKIIVFFRELMDQSWILSEKPDHQNLRNQNFNVQKSSPGLSL